MTRKSDDPRILIALGKRLRRTREDLDLRLGEVGDILGSSYQAVCNHEAGIRSMSFSRFLDHCFALKVSPIHMMAAVLADVYDDIGMMIDLRALAEGRRPAPASLRKWASRKLATLPYTQDGVLPRTLEQIGEMADVLGMDMTTLVECLEEFTPGRGD